jgi:hypothetical protein
MYTYRYLEQQQKITKLKLRCETSIEYESRKCTHIVQGGLLGGVRALQSNINIYCYPQPEASHWKLKLCLAAGRAGFCNALYSYLILAFSMPTAYAGTCQAVHLTLCSLRTGFQQYYIMLFDYHSVFHALCFQETIKNFYFFSARTHR